MQVKFKMTRVIDDYRKGTPQEEKFEADKVYDLADASARRWIARGIAVPADGSEAEGRIAADTKQGEPAGAQEDAEAAAANDGAASSDAADAAAPAGRKRPAPTAAMRGTARTKTDD